MKAFPSKLYAFSCGFIQIFSLVFTGLLLICNFFLTCYAENMETQQVLTKWDNPLWGAAGIFLFTGIFFGVCFLSEFLSSRTGVQILSVRHLLFLVLAWILFAGAALILFGKTVPAADAMSVYDAAQALAEGNTAVIHPTDSYLSYYPQQIGLAAFYELLIRLFKLLPTALPAYHFIKGVNVILACVIVLFQYKTVHLIWQDTLTDKLYLLFAAANLPFLMYTSFVYGEIPSFAAASVSLYCLAALWKIVSCSPDAPPKGTGFSRSRSTIAAKWIFAVCAVVFLALSVMLRKNSLILVIAVLLVLAFQWLKTKRALLLLLALVCGLASFTILPLVQKSYELRAGSSLKSGVPAIAYLAMGMQESSRGNGWYNGFNFNTYQETGMDTQATAAISRDAIAARLRYFKEHPDYTARFYLGKQLSQWADGTYAARQATLATFGGRREFFNSLYTGAYSRYFIGYCNIYQNVLCLGVFLFFLKNPGRSHCHTAFRGLPVYLGIIGVIGGFLFHSFWEANSRYIFLYGLLLLPYGAGGLAGLYSRLTRKIMTTQKR